MNENPSPNWIEASRLLRDAMEQYRDQHQYLSLAKVIENLIGYIDQHCGKWLSEKTIQRDSGNRNDRKNVHAIPGWRVKIYTQWLHEAVGKDQDWISTWLEATAYTAPGKLLMEISDAEGNIHKAYRAVKSNVPSLKSRLWGRFLGRQREIERLRQWADQQRHPIAVLYGFGGNGKTTIQQKVGEEFVHGMKSPLRWPYDGAVWISALDYPRRQPSLQDVLRKIATVFELYGPCTQEDIGLIPSAVLTKDVVELLENKRILTLLDNFETVARAHQGEILQFFNDLRGASQTLISTRYRPDWFLEQEHDNVYGMARILIRVDGLSEDDAKTLIHDFFEAKSLSLQEFDPQEIIQLTAITQNNPKIILALLGLVEQGVSIASLLSAITSGTSEADRIYEVVIDRTWKEILTEPDKAMLMAKALFSHSVGEADLGQVAGIQGMLLHETIKKLATISFFEFDRAKQSAIRIRTHPLAQDFAWRVLHDHPEFEREAEARWWETYAQSVVQQAGHIRFGSQRSDLEEDVESIVTHLEHHLLPDSPYYAQAATLFGGHNGLGYTLLWWGRYDDVLRIAVPVLDFAVAQQDAPLIGECALRLIAVIHIKRQRFDEVDKYIGLALDQNTKLHDPWLEATIDSIRALLYSRRGYLGAGMQFCQNALKRYRGLENPYDIAVAYRILSSLTLALATKGLEDATDRSDTILAELMTVEEYCNESESYLEQALNDHGTQFNRSTLQVNRAIIARLRSDLDQARNLFQSCTSTFQSSFSVAHVYRELALVEDLAGNRDLAHSYDEKGISLFRQLGMLDALPSEHCYRMIDQMKQAGTW